MQTTTEQRLTNISPLILRLGLAVILAFDGLGRVGAIVAADTAESLVATPAGVNLALSWSTVAGGAEVLAAVLLTVGLLTRLSTLLLLGTAGATAYLGLAGPGESALAQSAASVFQTQGKALALLAVACMGLLVSGCGSLGVDRRIASRRRRKKEAASS